MLVTIFFFILLLFTFIYKETRVSILSKKIDDWVLDCLGLTIQGTIIPLFQTFILYKIYIDLFPQFKGSIDLPFYIAFLINFVFVDYLYYWNHRLFHLNVFWPIHHVHHSMTDMDVLGTSRNTIWTSFFIVYIWVNSLFIFLLKDPSGYAYGIAITACLDLWRHSKFIPHNNKLNSFLSRILFLTTPIDHSWHHSQSIRKNFGANFNIFDKFHGTYFSSSEFPNKLGVKCEMSLLKKLFFPYPSKEELK